MTIANISHVNCKISRNFSGLNNFMWVGIPFNRNRQACIFKTVLIPSQFYTAIYTT